MIGYEANSLAPYDVRFAEGIRLIVRGTAGAGVARDEVRVAAESLASAMVEPDYGRNDTEAQPVLRQWQAMRRELLGIGFGRAGAVANLGVHFRAYRSRQADIALARVRAEVAAAKSDYAKQPTSYRAGHMIESEKVLKVLEEQLVEFRSNKGMTEGWAKPIDARASLVDLITVTWHADHSVVDLGVEAPHSLSAPEL